LTFFDCTADLVGQLNGNRQKGMLQIDAPAVENFWLRHWFRVIGLWLRVRVRISMARVNVRVGVCGLGVGLLRTECQHHS